MAEIDFGHQLLSVYIAISQVFVGQVTLVGLILFLVTLSQFQGEVFEIFPSAGNFPVFHSIVSAINNRV